MYLDNRPIPARARNRDGHLRWFTSGPTPCGMLQRSMAPRAPPSH